ncbi:MAG: phosphoserine phosphatase SerB, partial [Bacteroidales bacterium]|nr:phosphoserine phosphatase SerB [Bacteroidales bacterium]
MKQEIILFKISGDDRPGLTSVLTGIIAEGGATILDIAQSDIHSTLSLGILFLSDNAGVIIKELLFAANKMGVNARFDPVDEDNYNAWVARQGKDRFIVTLLGPDISAPLISKVSGFIATQGLNIDAITRLTGRMPLNGENAKTKACVELSVRGTPIDKNAIHSEFVKLSRNMGYDISFQEDNLYRRNRRLICFDMDSTLIKTECIDQLAERAGVGDKVKAITERAMKGEIDFSESFARRVALLKGLNASVMKEIAENLPLMDGADRLLNTLKKYGYKVAILSGGFTFFCDYIKRRFNLDYVYA